VDGKSSVKKALHLAWLKYSKRLIEPLLTNIVGQINKMELIKTLRKYNPNKTWLQLFWI
jgi:hypothetical protein